MVASSFVKCSSEYMYHRFINWTFLHCNLIKQICKPKVYLSFIFFVIINSFILLSWVYVLSHKEFIFKLLTLLQIKIETFFFGKISAYDEIN